MNTFVREHFGMDEIGSMRMEVENSKGTKYIGRRIEYTLKQYPGRRKGNISINNKKM